MLYALISNNIVVNIAEWNGTTAWVPDSSLQVYQLTVPCNIGWNWNNGAPTNPNPEVHSPLVSIDLSNLDNLDRILRAIGLMTGRWAGKTPAQIKANFLTAYQDVG